MFPVQTNKMCTPHHSEITSGGDQEGPVLRLGSRPLGCPVEEGTLAQQRGFTVFMTGLSGAGKSTISEVLIADLQAAGRAVTVLDGDIVREMLSSELTFSREHRDLNIRRIGYIAGELVRHGAAVVVAAIAPFESAREEARALVERHGAFVLVHVATSLEVTEGRDVKGLYKRARAGEIAQFTGISDVYELPERIEVVVDGSGAGGTPADASAVIMAYLREQDLI